MSQQLSDLLYQKSTDIIKSPSDSRQYLSLEFANGLKVLVASDVESKKCAASMSVGVGSMNDPVDLPGLAHLCEHMLFVESLSGKPKSYQGYASLIAENGGSSNAFTARDQTNYHFDISPSAFPGALERFAKFFTSAPEFTEEALEKEVATVQSEFEMKLNNDSWRRSAVDATCSRENHSYQKFTTGNKTTLRDLPSSKSINVLEELRKFHKTFYSASVMSLVVVGNQSLTYLEGLVTSLFSIIPSNALTLPVWPEGPFGPSDCGVQIDILSVSDVKDLYLCFPIPDTRPFYKTFPHGYITRLLAHKGKGSLFSILSKNNLVNNLFINSSVPARGFGLLSLGFQVTIDGMKKLDDIVDLTFQYIKMIRSCGPQRFFWEEIKQILYTDFMFQDQDTAFEFVQRTSNLLHVYPLKDVLSVGYLISEYDSVVIQNFLDRLQPDNCRVMVMCNNKDRELNETEKWFEVKYSVKKIQNNKLNGWLNCNVNPEFHFPVKNEFISTQLNIKPLLSSQEWTSKIMEDDICHAWHFQESTIPKIFIRIEVFSPLPMVDPITYVANHLLGMSIKESLAEELYSASLAGLYYTLNPTLYGLEITLDGFDERMGLLTKRIMEGIAQVSEHLLLRFRSIKDSYTNGLQNSSSQSPVTQVPYFMSFLLRERRFSHSELLQAVQDLNEETVLSYHAVFIQKIKLEWLLYGNITEEEALELVKASRDVLIERCGSKPLLSCQSLRLREVEIPLGRRYVFHGEIKNHTNSCCAVFVQMGTTTVVESVILELIDQMSYQLCFDRLRNKENLGYIVRTSVRKSSGTQGLLIVVQGDRDPSEVESRIELFLSDMEKTVVQMGEDEFQRHKESVSLRKCDIPSKLNRKGTRVWNEEIYTRQYNFSRIQEELEILNSIEFSTVQSFYKKHIHPRGSHRRTLVLHLIPEGSNHKSTCCSLSFQPGDIMKDCPKSELITDVPLWKSKMKLYPAQLP